MANKTKRRLVTGIACAVPAVIAVPSLLALTQCGGKTSTEHIQLSGDTKKEMSKAVFNETITYEFLLNNVDDPTSVQIKLPNLTVNGKTVTEGQKLQMYTAQAKANGVVTIVFKRDEIIKAAQSNVTNDETVPYEVKFDVNLSNDQFNETLTGFKLDLTMPKFAVKESLTHASLASIYEEVEYGTPYEATITIDDHYVATNSDIDIKCDGTSIKKASETDIGAHISQTGNQTWKLYIDGTAIVGDIEIIVNAKASEYTWATELHTVWFDISGTPTEMFTFVGAPTTVTWESELNLPIKWITTGYNIKTLTIKCGDTELPISYDNAHLLIHKNTVVGNITSVSATFEVAEYTITTEDTASAVWVDVPEKIGFHEAFSGKLKLTDKGTSITSSTIWMGTGGRTLVKGSEYFVSTPYEEGDSWYVTVTIPADVVTADLTLEEFKAETIKHHVYNETTDEHIKFGNFKSETEWGLDLSLPLTYAVEGKTETYIQRGYKFKDLTITSDKAVQPLPYTIEYMAGTESYSTKDECVAGFKVSGDYLKGYEAQTIKFKATTEICKRTVSYTCDEYTEWDPSTAPSIATIESGLSVTLKPKAHCSFKKLTINRTNLDGQSQAEVPSGSDTWTYDETSGLLTIKPQAVTGNLNIKYETEFTKYEVQADTELCTWETATEHEYKDKTASYYYKDYYCNFKVNDSLYYEFPEGYKPTVTYTGTTETISEDKIHFDKISTGLYELHIDANTIEKAITITCKAEGIKRNVSFIDLHESESTYETKSFELVSKTPEQPTIDTGCVIKLAAKDGFKWTTSKDHMIITSKKAGESGFNDITDDCTWEPNTGTTESGLTMGTLTIPGKKGTTPLITGDITVTYRAEVIAFPVTYTGCENVDWGDLHPVESTVDDAGFGATFKPKSGYEFTTAPIVTFGTTVLTPTTEEKEGDYTWKVTNNIGAIEMTRDQLLNVLKGNDGSKAINISLAATAKTVPVTVETNDATDYIKNGDPSIIKDLTIDFFVKEGYTSLYELSTTTPKVYIGEDEEEYTLTDLDGWDTTSSTEKYTLKIHAAALTGKVKVTYETTPIGREVTLHEYGQGTDPSTWTYVNKTVGKPSVENPAIYWITPKAGHEFSEDNPKLSVEVGGQTITKGTDYTWVWDTDHYVLTVNATKLVEGVVTPVITGNIDIYAAADAIKWTGDVTADNCQTTTDTISSAYGQEVKYIFRAASHYEITEDTEKPVIKLDDGTYFTKFGWDPVEGESNAYALTITAENNTITQDCTITFAADIHEYTATVVADKCKASASSETVTIKSQAYTVTFSEPTAGYHFTEEVAPEIHVGSATSATLIDHKSWTVNDDGTATLVVDFTSTSATGKLTDDIYITYSAEVEEFDVDLDDVEHCTDSGFSGTPSVTGGGVTIWVKASYESGYKITNSSLPIVTIKGKSYSVSKWTTINEDNSYATLDIPQESIIGDIKFVYSAEVRDYNVTGSLQNITDNITGTKANVAKAYTATLQSSSDNHKVTEASLKSVLVGEEDVTSSCSFTVENDVGTLSIPTTVIKGDITITAEATPITYDVTVTQTTSAKITVSSTKATKGSPYTLTIEPNPNYEILEEGYTGLNFTGSLASYTVDSNQWSWTSAEKATYTIPATAITGAFGVSYTASPIVYDIAKTTALEEDSRIDVSSNMEATVETENYQATITFDASCTLSDIAVYSDAAGTKALSGVTVTAGSTDYEKIITISKGSITGDIYVGATVTNKSFTVTANPSKCKSTTTIPSSVIYSDTVKFTIVPDTTGSETKITALTISVEVNGGSSAGGYSFVFDKTSKTEPAYAVPAADYTSWEIYFNMGVVPAAKLGEVVITMSATLA